MCTPNVQSIMGNSKDTGNQRFNLLTLSPRKTLSNDNTIDKNDINKLKANQSKSPQTVQTKENLKPTESKWQCKQKNDGTSKNVELMKQPAAVNTGKTVMKKSPKHKLSLSTSRKPNLRQTTIDFIADVSIYLV